MPSPSRAGPAIGWASFPSKLPLEWPCMPANPRLQRTALRAAAEPQRRSAAQRKLWKHQESE
jgi:hypothetical protein